MRTVFFHLLFAFCWLYFLMHIVQLVYAQFFFVNVEFSFQWPSCFIYQFRKHGDIAVSQLSAILRSRLDPCCTRCCVSRCCSVHWYYTGGSIKGKVVQWKLRWMTMMMIIIIIINILTWLNNANYWKDHKWEIDFLLTSVQSWFTFRVCRECIM